MVEGGVVVVEGGVVVVDGGVVVLEGGVVVVGVDVSTDCVVAAGVEVV